MSKYAVSHGESPTRVPPWLEVERSLEGIFAQQRTHGQWCLNQVQEHTKQEVAWEFRSHGSL